MQFDLYSDLHDNWWSKDKLLDFKGIGTSLVAVIAGDISNDWDYTYEKLIEISNHYKHVIFVDGNHEHNHKSNIIQHCAEFSERIAPHRNITYLHKSCVVLDDTAFVGCNGWWTYDFCLPEMSSAECWEQLVIEGFEEEKLSEIFVVAKNEAKMLYNQIETFNNDTRITNIVVVTHTSPMKRFSYLPPNYNPVHYGRIGNSLLQHALIANTNKKVRTWCFGHVHYEFDEVIDGIRYVCHPRGREDEGIGEIYFPKLIAI